MSDPIGVNLDNFKRGDLQLDDKKMLEGEEDEAGANSQLKPVVGIYFTDGLYRSFSYLGCLRSLEKNNIPINIISGSGWGLLIASLYAKYKETSRVEWKLFQLMQSLRDEKKVFKNSWTEILEKFIDHEFKDDRVETFKIPLIIPFYDNVKESINYRVRGSLVPWMSSILNLQVTHKKIMYTSSILFEGLSLSGLVKRGADVVLVFDSLNPEANFSQIDTHTWGTYKRYLGRIKKENSLNKKEIFYLGDDKHDLDDPSKMNEAIVKGEDLCKDYNTSILEIINNWKPKKNEI